MSSTKEKAQGNWHEILTCFGADASCLDGKHHPCPACGGSDRFRFDDKDGSGSHICSQCGAGDGFELTRKMGAYAGFKETAAAIDEVMGFSGKPLSQADKAAYREKMERLRNKRIHDEKEAHINAAKECLSIWEGLSIANDSHPYLKAKGVKAHGLKIQGVKLVVPVRVDGEISSLQFIHPNDVINKEGKNLGNKFLFKGGKKSGGCCFIKGVGAFVICEGYATGASVYEATGLNVLIAFDSGNLMHVALKVRQKMPPAQIIIAADNDMKTDHNTGYQAAIEAAQAVGSLIALPVGKEGLNIDWNDVHAEYGLDVVAAGLANAFEPDSDIQPLHKLGGDSSPSQVNGLDSRPCEIAGGDSSLALKHNKDGENKTSSLLDVVQRLAMLSTLEY